jgi:hypothetical protein
MIKKIIYALFTILSFFCLNAAEIDKSILIEDNEPWQISWIKDNNNVWVLIVRFEKGLVRTYFKNAPDKLGIGLNVNNKPFKQEFTYYPCGKTFISIDCEYEQFMSGIKTFGFRYDEDIDISGKKLCFGVVTIYDQQDHGKSNIESTLVRRP